MAKVRTILQCGDCGQQLAQWAGRCPGCGAWGTIGERRGPGPSAAPASVVDLAVAAGPARRVATGFDGIDRVLGGGLVPASVALLAGEPGIGKSTLLLQLVASLSASGLACLVASGEESREQVAERARRLGISGETISFVPGRELREVCDAARATRPFLLAVDSIQTLRDPDSTGVAGGTSQVRSCADELVGLAKGSGIAVLMTGHVTKDGDLAGPRTLEHAVDVVLAFEGDPRSGHRVLTGGKNRFGSEGEMSWFEMSAEGLREIDPAAYLAPGSDGPGSATALPVAGRRAVAVEVQALAVPTDGPPRRQVSGLDPRRFQLIAAVLDRVAGIPLARTELYGASSGGVRIDEPGADLAIAAALASAAMGKPTPPGIGFVGEIGLTGAVRKVPGLTQRASAAAAAGLKTVFAGSDEATSKSGVRFVAVRDVREALRWATD